MKVEINNKEQNTEIKFPCLMISENEQTIILATREKDDVLSGFALKHNKELHFSKFWARKLFKPFNGSITLSNE